MIIRKPIVAGRFYPASRQQATAELEECLSVPFNTKNLPTRLVAGVVPHAGWICSGAVAGIVFGAFKAVEKQIDVFILFGAVHRLGTIHPAVFNAGEWETPLGPAVVDDSLAAKILKESTVFRPDHETHALEHSLEVQVPFIRYLFPNAKILPILVHPTPETIEVGRAVAAVVRRENIHAVAVGSTDLTHYGPGYGFTPKGPGPEGLRWAKNVNDRGLLDRIEKMDPQAVLNYAEKTQSACGPGAVAATIAYAQTLGADTVQTLEHVTSDEVLSKRFGEQSDDAVGYAGIVFGIK